MYFSNCYGTCYKCYKCKKMASKDSVAQAISVVSSKPASKS